jgi:hypothetical protein
MGFFILSAQGVTLFASFIPCPAYIASNLRLVSNKRGLHMVLVCHGLLLRLHELEWHLHLP